MCTPYDTVLGKFQISVTAGESQYKLSISEHGWGNVCNTLTNKRKIKTFDSIKRNIMYRWLFFIFYYFDTLIGRFFGKRQTGGRENG